MTASELYDAIKLAGIRINQAWEEYTRCKTNVILAGKEIFKKYDDENRKLIAEARKEYDYLLDIFYALEFKLDPSVIVEYDMAEARLNTIEINLKYIETYSKFIRFCLNSHNKAS